MSLRSVLEKLNVLANTPSSNTKKVLLKDFLQDSLFLKVVKATVDQRYHYNTKELPPFSAKQGTSVPLIFKKLGQLSKQGGASDRDKLDLTYHSSIDRATWEVVQRIVKKDLRCGVSGKTINNVIPNTVVLIPYCRCSSEKKIDKILFPAFAQCKADGMFSNIICSSDKKIGFLTRNGHQVRQLHKLRSRIKRVLKYYPEGIVPMGELLIFKDGEILPRKTGNGILNQCVQGTAKQSDADCAILRIWDVISYKGFWAGKDLIPYEQRFLSAQDFVKKVNHKSTQLVQTEIVNSLKEAKEFYSKMRSKGEEGAVLKNKNVVWKFHTSTGQVKMKNEIDIELELIDWYQGDKFKKYEKCLGGLVLRSKSEDGHCGMLLTNVGSGFSDKMRGYNPVDENDLNATPRCHTETKDEAAIFIDKEKAAQALHTWNELKGSIVQITCESVIKDKRKNTYSCFLPRFNEIRNDKSEADSLSEILGR